jgi:superoxide reductase
VSASGDGAEVQVGSVPHPMSAEHHIAFVYVETEQGGQRKKFKIDGEPKTSFLFADDKPVAYYAYCNLHGLWKVEA